MNPRERGSFVHPRQEYLHGLINNGHILPPGARELIEEAIKDYQVAFGRNWPEPKLPDIDTEFYIIIPHGEEGEEITAGRLQKVITRFVGDEKRLNEETDPFTITVVEFHFLTAPNVPIYPDVVRCVPIDANGNSRPSEFLFSVPEYLSGDTASFQISVSLGGSLLTQRSLNLAVK